MAKIKWEVSPAPTGQYRSFHRRGWPVGQTEDGVTFLIGCDDDYVPRNVKSGKHAPLKLKFRDDNVRGSTVRVFKRKFATLAELKDFASNIDTGKIKDAVT
jgi:hypothetical protein